MKQTMKLEIRVVIYREDDLFVAHCLEMNLVGCGESPIDAARELDGNIAAQIESASRLGIQALFHPAPPEIWAMFEAPAKPSSDRPAFSDRSTFDVRRHHLDIPLGSPDSRHQECRV